MNKGKREIMNEKQKNKKKKGVTKEEKGEKSKRTMG